MLLLALVWSSTCVGADARDPWYRRGRRERPGIPLWKPPTSSSDEDPVVVEVTGSAPQDAAPAPRIDAIEAIENVDLEAPGALEKALAARARASDKELMVLAVGDTRDHRRMNKDPALSQVSVDFAINLVENLAALGLRNYLMLTSSAQLCDELRRDADVDGCAHSSHLTDRETELERWGLKPGDMFLLWAQQWRVVQRALEGGYSVMRVDSDVVFLEDPYLALRGPLLSPFAMISQTDVFDLGTRPRCDPNSGVVETPGHSDVKRCVSSSVKGQPQLNIGLVYFRRSAMADDGPTIGAIKDMLAAFTARLLGDVQVNDDGDPISEALLDQPLFREAVSQRVRLGGGWKVASGHGGEVYARGGDGEAAGSSRKQPEAPGDECPHARATCDAIAAERRRTDIAFAALGKEGSELVAGAPDWLFGRGCVKTVADAPRSRASSIDSIDERASEFRRERRERERDVRDASRRRQPRARRRRRRRRRRRGAHGVQQGSQACGRDGGDGLVARAHPSSGRTRGWRRRRRITRRRISRRRRALRRPARGGRALLAHVLSAEPAGRAGVRVRGGHAHRHVPVLRARSRRGRRGSVVGAKRGERRRARRAGPGGSRGRVDGGEAGGPHRDRAGLRDAPERRVERVLGQVKGRDGRGRVERFVVSRRRCVRLYWDLRWLSKKSFDRSIDQYPSSSS